MSIIELNVPGMSCGHCERAVRSEVAKVAGVREVAVDLESKNVRVEGDGIDPDALRAAVREAGHEPVT